MSFSQSTSTTPSSVYIPPPNTADPVGWIQSSWDAFVNLWTQLLNLEHQAAQLAATTPAGSYQHEVAMQVVQGCSQVMSIQTKVQAWVESHNVLGLQGLGQVIAGALVVAFAGIMAIMFWCYTRYNALQSVLAGVNNGSLSATQASNLLQQSAKTPDLSVIGGATSWFGLGILAAGAAFLYFWSRRRETFVEEPEENPGLVVLGANPQPADIWSYRVLSLDYIHDDDGQAYTHAFKPGVRMQALADGGVRLYNPRRRIWREF